jgi:thymidine kinase
MSLKLYLGPMCSGKTHHLIADLNRFHDLECKVLYINSSKDTRDPNSEYSANSKRKPAIHCDKKKAGLLSEVDVSVYSVIGIDEGQFFEDLPETVRSWMSSGKSVICAGLDGDFRQKPFGRILELVPLCSSGKLFKLEAACDECRANNIFTDAGYTKRTVPGTQIELIGGKEFYRPVCWNHINN